MTDKNIEAKSALLVEKNGAVTTISINDAPWNRMSLEFMNELEPFSIAALFRAGKQIL